MAETQVNQNPATMPWKAGVIGSLVGGLVFGMMMAMMGMLPMIAGLIGSKSSIVGFIVHMVISLIFGFAFAIFTSLTKWHAVMAGIIFGMILWLLFPFIMMPIMMGKSEMAFQITSGTMMSLMGHVIYGMVTGMVYKKMAS